MKKILVTGAAGQIGSELVPALRERYGADNVVAGIHHRPLTAEVQDGGPAASADVTDRAQIDEAMKAAREAGGAAVSRIRSGGTRISSVSIFRVVSISWARFVSIVLL